MKKQILVAWLVCFSSFAFADSATKFDYPELMVTPRASERLEMEAKKESESTWTKHIPIQVSAVATLTSGLMMMGAAETGTGKEGQKYAAYAGLGVGAGWLIGTYLLGQNYTPYANGVKEIASMPKGSAREQLARERMAEEAIDHAASIGRRLTWLSVITQAGASAYIVASAPKSTFAQTAAAASIAIAFTPLIFKYRWIHVAREQQEYKKKIYAPIAQFGMLASSNPLATRYVPGMLLSWSF